MLVLGVDLRIRRFTPAAAKALNLVPDDVGRPIGSLQLAVDLPDLEALVAEVIDTVQPAEREVRDRDGRWYALRIHPYRTADNKIDGAVRGAGRHPRGQGDRGTTAGSRSSSHGPSSRRSANLSSCSMSTCASGRRTGPSMRTFQVQETATEGRLLYELGNHQWDIPRLRELLEEVLVRRTTIEGYEVTHEFESIGRRTMILNARRIVDDSGKSNLILLAIDDITEKRRTEESLRRSEECSRLLLENVTDYAVFFMDPAGHVVGWDEGASCTLGYRTGEISGQPLSRFFTPEDVERGLPARGLQVAERDGCASDENWLVRKDGSRFWAGGATTALRDEAGGLRVSSRSSVT